MEIRYIDEETDLSDARAMLVGLQRIALDLEAAGFHRYDDRLSLVQLTAGSVTYLLDPFTLPLGDFLRPVLEDPGVELVMHGSDYDLRLLDRDLGIRPRYLFDTQVAASLLGRDAIGLSALLEEHFDVRLSKKYQRADWAQRPLPPELREYAAMDTAYLEPLADQLRDELEERGRLAWAEEEFEALREIRYQPQDDRDPVTRVKAARDLSPRELVRLREALAWRDEIAQERDRATFRVTPDGVLVTVAKRDPSSVGELSSIQGMNGGLARQEGEHLLERLSRANAIPDAELARYPRPQGDGRGRPEPEVEERFHRLRKVRNRVAGELGLDRGTLLPNALLQSLAESPPGDLEEMARAEGLRRWQAATVGAALMEALAEEATAGT